MPKAASHRRRGGSGDDLALELHRRYAAELTARGLAANSVRLWLAPVKALLATAVEEGLIRSNPSAGLRIARPDQHVEQVEEPSAKALTDEQLRALLGEIPEPWQLLVRFLANSGLRISEALGLTWGDVDFGRRRVLVRRRMRAGKVGPTKSGYSRRDVPLTVGMARALWTARGSAPESELVFPARQGGPLDRSHVYRVVQAAGKRAGVPWVGLHTLRHTAATLAFKYGWNAKQVQMLLGHHSPAFTLATYVHLLPEDLPEPNFLGGVLGTDGDDGEAAEELGGASDGASREGGDLVGKATARAPLLGQPDDRFRPTRLDAEAM